MLSIYTYPNHSATGYINPNYYGATTGGSETGYYKRILDLKDGTYKAWVTGQTAPVDTVSDLITATGKFHKAVRTENGLENIMIYSYYNQPLITIDSVLINTDVSASDTDASPAVRLTVADSSDFVDGDNVLLSGFDNTLADRNGHELHVDIINSTTVDLYYDSALTNPVKYFTSIPNQTIANINFDSATPLTTPVKVTLTGLGSSYDTASFTAASGGNDSQQRLNALGMMYIDNAAGEVFELYQDLNEPVDALTIDEFLNDDYSKDWGQLSGDIDTIEEISTDSYYISNTLSLSSVNIYKIQKQNSSGAWVNGLNNLAYAGPYTVNTNGSGDTLVYDYGANPATDTPKSTDDKADVMIHKNTVVHTTATPGTSGEFPGVGRYLKPIHDDTGKYRINTHDKCILARTDATDSWDSEIETNSVVGAKFHWYGQSFGVTPVTDGWRYFVTCDDDSGNPLEYTEGSITYHVYGKDTNLRGDYAAGLLLNAYKSGTPTVNSSNDTVFCSTVYNQGNTNFNGYAWVGTIPNPGNPGTEGDYLWRKMKDIWDNNKAEAVYADIGTAGDSPVWSGLDSSGNATTRKVAIFPVAERNFTNNYNSAETFIGYEVRWIDVEYFDDPVAYQGGTSLQTYSPSLQH